MVDILDKIINPSIKTCKAWSSQHVTFRDIFTSYFLLKKGTHFLKRSYLIRYIIYPLTTFLQSFNLCWSTIFNLLNVIGKKRTSHLNDRMLNFN